MNRILTSLFQEILFLAKRLNICLMFSLALLTTALCAQTVSDVTFASRHPWNGLVDITFRIDGYLKDLQVVSDNSGLLSHGYPVIFTGYDQDWGESFELKTFLGQTEGFTKAGTYTVTWDAAADCPEFAAKNFRIKAQLVSENGVVSSAPQGNSNSTYLVIDLSGGAEAQHYPCRYTNTAPILSSNACRTTELWLRRIPKGTFLMGSPEDELGRRIEDEAGRRIDDETQHQVTLKQDFYIGVFEMTQKQYELVMGSNPSYYKGDTRPVEQVSYNDLRGTSAEGGAGWPEKGHAVDAGSFFGVLRTKTGLLFDLPTEAQWEYACRAGTTTALNSGKNLTAIGECPNMAEVGRYYCNRKDGKGGYGEDTKVGSYLPNAWGLYDMHGNVEEWCLDWYGGYPTKAVNDPAGAGSGSKRVVRGGDWDYGWYGYFAQNCRSAYRSSSPRSGRSIGFRVVCLP